MRLDNLFARKKASGEKTFVAYITAGDPSAEATVTFVDTLAKNGVDIVELGVPHSDPVADGETNVRAAERALKQGGGLRQTLQIARRIRQNKIETPLVLFTYFNPLLRMGLEAFAREASESGIDGVLIVDLPSEEANEYRSILHDLRLATVFLAAPTTTPERLSLVNEKSSGFVYYVSRAGVTGAQSSLSETLSSEITSARQKISLPLCVGFGISTPEQVAEVAKLADGVVVGSALVRCIEAADSVESAARALETLTTSLVSVLKHKEISPC